MLELLGPSQAGAPDQVLASKEMTLGDSGLEASGHFDLDPRETGYRIIIWDTVGFANRVIPRRGISQLPDEPPQVALLPERLGGSSEDNEVEGIPIPFGDRCRVAYRAAQQRGTSTRLVFAIASTRTRSSPSCR